MAALQTVRGTHDLLPDMAARHHRVIDIAREITSRYGYGRIETPIFEFTEVFQRTLGETSDVVTKEMYTFEDRGGERLTLRPEGTAGIARAYISNGLQQHNPCRFFYAGPMFRYERPQKGRQRQFHQIGVELLGVDRPLGDVETIAMGVHILEALGLKNHLTLEINSLGDPESRAAYRDALVAYFDGHRDRLSEDSRQRLDRNPLRILDSKDPGDRELIAEAPLMGDYLNEASREFYDQVRAGLEALDVPMKENPRLVRGLDYYSHTAFEVTTTRLGAQGTVLAGGRYDGLIAGMGGPPTAGIGWAAGIERLALLMDETLDLVRPVALVPLGTAAEARAMVLADQWRRAGLSVDMAYGGNLKKRLKQANKVNARQAVLLGDDELARGVATVRDLDSGEQTEVALTELEDRLAGRA